MGAEPYSVIAEDDLVNARYIQRFHYKPIPIIIAMELEEFIYCLRSGLDNLAWQLALLKSSNPSEDIGFPIFAIAEARFDRRLRPSTAPVQDAIRSLQPYRRGDSFDLHPLRQLNKLSNLAKHSIVQIHSQAVPITLPINVSFVRSLDEGIEISVPMALKKELQSKPRFPMEIVLGKSGTQFEIPPSRLTK